MPCRYEGGIQQAAESCHRWLVLRKCIEGAVRDEHATLASEAPPKNAVQCLIDGAFRLFGL